MLIGDICGLISLMNNKKTKKSNRITFLMSSEQKMAEDKKELWLDLHSLVSSSTFQCDCHKKNYCPDGNTSYLIIYYEYSKKYPEPLHDSKTYLLRVALRALGHKIRKIENHLYDDMSAFMVQYTTSITEEEYRQSDNYNGYIADTVTDIYGYGKSYNKKK